MTDPSPMSLSRREWFRLRPQKTQLDGHSSLSPLPDPVNYGGLDVNDLPPIREALLGASEVLAVVDDIKMHATEVKLMWGARTPSDDNAGVLLKEAADGLLRGEYRRIQVRYGWRGSLWIDTLTRTEDGIRLVRIEHA